jgi:outer membrane protein TolC
VDNRREFAVALKAIRSAQQGLEVAKADFRPRVYTLGSIAQVSGAGILNEEVQIGGIHCDIELFEGGRRKAAVRDASAGVRASVARAQLVCDEIAFEINDAYWAIDAARQQITLARTAVRQATETLRLVTNRYRTGDATPTDVVDGETALTRAQQSYYRALYDYLTALARIDYAMGTTWVACPTGP